MPNVIAKVLFDEDGNAWGMFCYANNVTEALEAFTDYADLDGALETDICSYHDGTGFNMFIMPIAS